MEMGLDMKVFISWSGETSRKIAEELGLWIPMVLQSIEPIISVEIPKGKRWNEILGDQLQNTDYGISCITSGNVREPWIQFEAGAISKPKKSIVVPLLLGAKTHQLTEPLSQFQAAKFDKPGMFGIIKSLYEGSEDKIKANFEVVKRAFDILWNDFYKKVDTIIHEEYKKSLTFWEQFTGSHINIIFAVGERKGKEITITTNDNELFSLLEIFNYIVNMRTQNTKISITSDATYIEESRKLKIGKGANSSWIIIGGPKRNKLAESIFEKRLKLKFDYAQDKEYSEITNSYFKIGKKRYKVTYGEAIKEGKKHIGREVHEDIGVAIKLSDKKRTSLILCGCHAYGSFGATQGITDEKTIKELYDHLESKRKTFLDDFVAIFKTEVRDNVVNNVIFSDLKLL